MFSKPLQEFIKTSNTLAIDLVDKLLCINPYKRYTAEEALNHSFIEDAEILHDYNRTYVYKPSPSLFEFENNKYQVPDLRMMVIHEVENSSKYPYQILTTSIGNDHKVDDTIFIYTYIFVYIHTTYICVYSYIYIIISIKKYILYLVL